MDVHLYMRENVAEILTSLANKERCSAASILGLLCEGVFFLIFSTRENDANSSNVRYKSIWIRQRLFCANKSKTNDILFFRFLTIILWTRQLDRRFLKLFA